MAGHSKWANIKNRKGAQDAKRGKLFSQLAKNIKSAVKEGESGDANTNPALRLALEKARAANMPKDNIQRAIDRGLGKTASGQQLKEVQYEGFGPQGVGVIITTVTDNQQRTSSDVRNILTKSGGSLGSPGSVGYLFNRDQSGEFQPSMPLEITDQTVQSSLQEMVDKLLNLDDVEDVYLAATWAEQQS